ncbi:MAG: FGGY family carbohydrate kinase [Kiloniellales bacterium]|nr:FGGY family carbohydrate kinase [Kiloniellales bacterium]
MYVGVDIGTQSLKAVVCNEVLEVAGEAAVSYEPSFPRPGWAEQDPALWERALAPAVARALANAGIAPDDVRALGIAGQLDGCIAVGRDGTALAPALIWMDRRSVAEVADVDPALVLERAGVVLDATHMAAKIRWLQRHGPEGARRYHQPVSYMVARLTGEHRMDHGLASTTMLYDLARRAYDETLLERFEISGECLPQVAEASELAGHLSAAGAAMAGLPAGLPVAVGTGDDFSNPLGAGLATPGRVACALGTAEVVGALSAEAVIDRAALVETHAYAGGLFFVENPGWLSGGALTWFVKAHRLADAAELDTLAGQAPPGAEGLAFLPALSGAMAPEWIAEARGSYYGLTPGHGTGHMARAVLEGCAFAMRDVVERLIALGLPVSALLLVGGGAKSALWARIRADATGLPAEIPSQQDTSPIGAAMLAAVAVGAWPDLASAAAQVGEIERVVEPDPAAKDAYDQAHARYRELFECLRPLYR